MTNINQLRGGINGLTLTHQAELTILDSPSMQAFLAELARGRAQLQKNLEEFKNGNSTLDSGTRVSGDLGGQQSPVALSAEEVEGIAQGNDWAEDRIDQRI